MKDCLTNFQNRFYFPRPEYFNSIQFSIKSQHRHGGLDSCDIFIIFILLINMR
jgi:hypothetical protein